MLLDLKRVAAFIREADDEALLDRVTIYRLGMEPSALDLMEMELDRRGFSSHEIERHDEDRRKIVIFEMEGFALRCNYCDRPAIRRATGWHKLFGRLPIFPRLFNLCSNHVPPEPEVGMPGENESLP